MSVGAITAYLTDAGLEHAYSENGVPSKPNYPYAVIGLSYAAPGPATMDGHKSTPSWLTVRIFARTNDTLATTAALVDAALNGRALPVPGDPVAEFIQASQVARDADDAPGVIGTLLVYRF